MIAQHCFKPGDDLCITSATAVWWPLGGDTLTGCPTR